MEVCMALHDMCFNLAAFIACRDDLKFRRLGDTAVGVTVSLFEGLPTLEEHHDRQCTNEPCMYIPSSTWTL
jgi:hypothetical protein